MTQTLNIYGVLIQWGDRLFSPCKRMVKVPPSPRFRGWEVLRACERHPPAHRSHGCETSATGHVKVTGGRRGMLATAAHFRCISKNWAAAGSVDTDLSFLSLLELYGTEIAERRMPSRRVVEALDVVEYI